MPLHFVHCPGVRLTVGLTGRQHTPDHLEQTVPHCNVGFLPAHSLHPALELPPHNAVVLLHGGARGLSQSTSQNVRESMSSEHWTLKGPDLLLRFLPLSAQPGGRRCATRVGKEVVARTQPIVGEVERLVVKYRVTQDEVVRRRANGGVTRSQPRWALEVLRGRLLQTTHCRRNRRHWAQR